MAQGVKLPYSDDDLRIAIESSKSWRGVMRQLGYVTTNGRLATKLRLQAEALKFDSSHFGKAGGSRPRSWPLAQIEAAVRDSASWSEVAGRLGLSPGSGEAISRVSSYAARLGLDHRHFSSYKTAGGESLPFEAQPDPSTLRRAAISMATAWFTRRGYGVSLPIEPQPYDLIVDADSILYRVQVKTATRRDAKSGQYCCAIGRRPARDGVNVPYNPAEVDYFFIIDGDENFYIVPLADIGGRISVTVSVINCRKVNGRSLA